MYAVGLGATYIAAFGEYEGVGLASFSRYLNIAFVAVLLVIGIGAARFCDSLSKYKRTALLGFLCLTLLMFPVKSFVDYIRHVYVRSSSDTRELYLPLANKIRSHCTKDSKIWVISQEDLGYDYWVLHFEARPSWALTEASGWNLGGPFHGEVETRQLTPKEWKDILIQEGYTHVALYKLNDYFIKTYSVLFDDPDDMENNSLFKLGEDGMLGRVE